MRKSCNENLKINFVHAYAFIRLACENCCHTIKPTSNVSLENFFNGKSKSIKEKIINQIINFEI